MVDLGMASTRFRDRAPELDRDKVQDGGEALLPLTLPVGPPPGPSRATPEPDKGEGSHVIVIELA